MKCLLTLFAALSLVACAGRNFDDSDSTPKTAPAQVGIVNHTGNYIYSASANGAGGGGMTRWGAGTANICCASIPRVWYPGMKVHVRWDMPDGHTHNVKEKIVDVEKYDTPGSIYLHFFPNDQIRVVVTNLDPNHPEHPIPLPVKPANAK